MTTENIPTTDRTVTIRAAELDDLAQALRHYRHAYLGAVDASAQQTTKATMSTIMRHGGLGRLWIDCWLGLNHQRIAPGDQARYDADGEMYPCTVLDVYRYGALVQYAEGVEWMPWHQVHRPDRLHSEPDFDIANYAAIADHMGYPRNRETEPDPVPPVFLAPAERPPLLLVDSAPASSDTGTDAEPRRYGTDWLGAVALDLLATPEGLADGKAYVDDLTSTALGTPPTT
jgi:hypothetical protein